MISIRIVMNFFLKTLFISHLLFYSVPYYIIWKKLWSSYWSWSHFELLPEVCMLPHPVCVLFFLIWVILLRCFFVIIISDFLFCPTRRFSFWNALRSAWWHQLTVPQRKWPTTIAKGIKKYVSFVVYWWSCCNSFSILTDTISFVIFYFFVVCCLYWMFLLLFLSSPYIIQKAVDK